MNLSESGSESSPAHRGHPTNPPVVQIGTERLAPMRFEDLDAVMAVERTLYTHPWSRLNFADSISAEQSGAGYSTWVMKRNDDLIGYFVLMVAVDEAHLLNLSVARPFQRQGFANLLIGMACQLARQARATGLLLEVRPSNAPAQALYSKLGFQKIGVRRNYYPKGDIDSTHPEDALVMKLTLS